MVWRYGISEEDGVGGVGIGYLGCEGVEDEGFGGGRRSGGSWLGEMGEEKERHERGKGWSPRCTEEEKIVELKCGGSRHSPEELASVLGRYDNVIEICLNNISTITLKGIARLM